MSYKASAPGSLMILGEHAVLHGHQALVCALDRRVTVCLSPREDQQILIYSSMHGEYHAEMNTLKIQPPFEYVIATLLKAPLISGCNIHITSTLSDQLGFGSSAAVVVATLSVLSDWLQLNDTSFSLLKKGQQIVREVQGVGSGADIAASVYGGMVAFTADPLRAEKLPTTYPLTVIYSGYKTKTAVVIEKVREKFANNPALFKQLCQSIGECSESGILHARLGEDRELGQMLNRQQDLMVKLGVSTNEIDELIALLNDQASILGAKISGSGLGDCVIGLGKATFDELPCGLLQTVKMTEQGVQNEKS